MRNTILAAASALLLASPAVLAQTGATSSGAAATDSRPAAGATAAPGAATSGAATGAASTGAASTSRADSGPALAGPPEIVRSSRLRGQDIENANGDNIGEIEELVIDPKSGQVKQVIVSVGGFLGLGKKDVALKWDQLKIHQELRKTTTAPATGAPGTGTAPAGGAGTAASPATGASGTAATEASTEVRPTDRVRVVVNMTKEQLEAAPEFKFDDAAGNGAATSGAGTSSSRNMGSSAGGATGGISR
jgi:sporulation protein YlmC with PRC-barrel domain